MFRKGGSVSGGITSGLDTPKRGLVDGPGGYGGDEDKILGQYLREADLAKKLTDKIYPKEKPDINEFLINFGLNLASQTPTGNLFSTAATAAKAPTQQLFQDINTQKASRRDLETGLFGTLVKARTDLASANKLGVREGYVVKSLDQFNKLDKAVNDFNEGIISEQELASITNRVEKITELYGVDIKDDLKQFTNEKMLTNTLADIEEDLILEDSTLADPKNKRKLRKAIEEELYKRITQAKIRALSSYSVTLQQLADQEDQENETEEKAEGGRIGYQNAGPVMPSAMPSNMPAPGIMSQAPENMDQEPSEPSISFEELRARLPSEITDDIVKLISESPQALEDFATIQTQQDVNNFNTKYGVNLTLPPEA